MFVLAILYGKYQWHLKTNRLRTQLNNRKRSIVPKTYELQELENLPSPVRRYFQTVLIAGQPIVASVNLTQEGLINTSEEVKAKWCPFTATQYVTTQRAGFDWDARIQMVPGVCAFVHDAYVLGAGSLHASILGLFTVAYVSGTSEATLGELLRYFAEMPWYPTALLPSQGVIWEAIDDTSSRATLTDNLTTVSLVFRFGSKGLIETVRAECRYRDKVTAMPWSGRFWNYSMCNNMFVPLEGEVGWEYPEGLRLYWKGKVTEINYEFTT